MKGITLFNFRADTKVVDIHTTYVVQNITSDTRLHYELDIIILIKIEGISATFKKAITVDKVKNRFGL